MLKDVSKPHDMKRTLRKLQTSAFWLLRSWSKANCRSNSNLNLAEKCVFILSLKVCLYPLLDSPSIKLKETWWIGIYKKVLN